MYQYVRKRTTNVLGLELMMPREVAAAQRKAMPTSSAISDAGRVIAVWTTGAARMSVATTMELPSFQKTKRSRRRGAA